MFVVEPLWRVQKRLLRPLCRASNIETVATEESISRGEVTAMLFAFADINVKVGRIVELLEDDENGAEEETPKDEP